MFSSPLHPTASLRKPQYDRFSERIVGTLTQLIAELHRMMGAPQQRVAQEFDLTAELSALRAAYEQIGNLRMILALHPAAIEVLTQQEAREILQIVRETLGSCIRSQATQATVSIRKRGARICLRIGNNGAGFKLVDGRIQNESVALIEIRARKIGGTVRTRVDEGQGSQLLVEFSLEPVLVSI
jgi:nitrate/nitrite-specific signal transduction histidine kinase